MFPLTLSVSGFALRQFYRYADFLFSQEDKTKPQQNQLLN